METIVTWMLALLGIYLLLGFVFAVPFVLFGAKKVDPSAVEGTWGFKLLIIPGAAIFWPCLVRRWMKGSPPPEECSAHRRQAYGGQAHRRAAKP